MILSQDERVSVFFDFVGSNLDGRERSPIGFPQRLPVRIRHHIRSGNPGLILILPPGVFHFPENHALIHELSKRLRGAQIATIEKYLVPKSRIEQVENRVFRSTNVEIDRHPPFFFFLVDEDFIIFRIDKAEIVPTGASPLGHGIGFSAIPFSIDHRIKPFIVGLRQRRFRTTVWFEVLQVRQIDR